MHGLEDPIAEAAEIEAGHIWRAELYGAIRTFALSYLDASSGLKGFEGCAAALDRRWGEHGRPVSGSLLRAALADSERNYFRAEWLDWFACRSGEVADILGRRIKPTKSDREQLDDLKAQVREEMPRHADAVIRRAAAR